MKKIFSLLVALVMLASLEAAPAEGVQAPETKEAPLSAAGEREESFVFPEYSYEELTVGNPTPVEGKFFTEMWGNNTSDLDVRQLLHGYNLVSWDEENGLYVANPVVVTEGGIVVYDNESGDRTYLLTLYSDLKFSDGTPITAFDYAFTILMQISPVIREIGGTPLRVDYIQGYEEYMAGNPVLSGLRVLADHQLRITVRHEYLPFFYELGLLDCLPYPIHVIAPGCSVKDDGNGAYIDGPFTAELLRNTIMNPESGYLSHPAVGSGPYVLTKFDGNVCEFERNPYFKGDADGMVPMIERLRLVPVNNETMAEGMRTGKIGLLNKVTRADSIEQLNRLTGTGYYTYSNYPRLGLAFLSFNCERPAVRSAAVRRAIAHCMDKDQLTADYTGNFGLRVDGYYGLGQWMYQLVNGTMMYPVEEPGGESGLTQTEHDAQLAAWQALTLEEIPKYDLDPSAAARLLEEDGWKKGPDGIREKEGVRLNLTLAYPAGSRVADSMETSFRPHLEAAGIGITFLPMELGDLLDQFYHRGERSADLLFLGSNFDPMFDPAAHFHQGDSGMPSWDYTEAADEELYRLALEMRRTEPGNLLEYCQKWLAFQQRFAEVEPMIPLYSNVYFDYYPTILQQYLPSSSQTWSEAIVKAYLSDAEDAEEEEETGETETFID